MPMFSTSAPDANILPTELFEAAGGARLEPIPTPGYFYDVDMRA